MGVQVMTGARFVAVSSKKTAGTVLGQVIQIWEFVTLSDSAGGGRNVTVTTNVSELLAVNKSD